MRCPKCGSQEVVELVCGDCRTAWPDTAHLDPASAVYARAVSRWKEWTLEKRRAGEARRNRELIGA